MLGETVRRLRKEAGLTQVELAQKSGVSQVLISMIETGAIQDPRTSTSEQLADALGVTVKDLTNASAKA